MELYTKGGIWHIWAVDNPRGEPEYHVSKKELKDKFKTLVSPTLGESRVYDIINTLEKFEDIDDVRNLTKLLS